MKFVTLIFTVLIMAFSMSGFSAEEVKQAVPEIKKALPDAPKKIESIEIKNVSFEEKSVCKIVEIKDRIKLLEQAVTDYMAQLKKMQSEKVTAEKNIQDLVSKIVSINGGIIELKLLAKEQVKAPESNLKK